MSRSQDKRPQRVGQMLQEEISRLLISGLHDPRIGFVTITEVRVTHDLRHARIYVSAYAEQAEREESIAGLNAAAGFIKRELSHVLRLQFIPTLDFVLDQTLDGAQRLNEVLSAIDRGDQDAPQTETQETLPVTDTRSALHERGRQLDDLHRLRQDEQGNAGKQSKRGRANTGRKSTRPKGKSSKRGKR